MSADGLDVILICSGRSKFGPHIPRVLSRTFRKDSFGGLVGARGFEPPTPWSRTRCATRLRYAPNVLR